VKNGHPEECNILEHQSIQGISELIGLSNGREWNWLVEAFPHDMGNLGKFRLLAGSPLYFAKSFTIDFTWEDPSTC
jgi:hypothetical protein